MSAHRSSLIVLTALLGAVLVAGIGSGVPAAAAPAEDKPHVHVYPGVQPFDISHPANATGAEPSASSGDSDFGLSPQAGGLSDQGKPATGAEGNSGEQPGAAAEQPGGDSSAQPQAEAGTSDAQATTSESSAGVSQEDADQARMTQLLQRAAQHYELASHYFSHWDLDLAEVELDETVCIFPEFRIAHRDLCLLALLKFNFPRSLAEFMMVTGLTDPTPYSDEDKTALDDKAMKLHYNKALALGKQDKWNDAITELMWAQTYAPGNAMVHHSLAFAYASSGDFTKAEDEYKTVFQDAPSDGMAHADFANLLADRGNSAKAEAEMRQAVALSPNAAALHVDLGWLAESRKDLPAAETEFKAAVKLSPRHSGLWTHLARIEEHMGDITNAEQSYGQALQLDAQNEEAKDSLDRLKNQKKPDA